MIRQIILDTETTGISVQHNHRVIEVGCLEMVNRRLTGNSFHRYINPQREIEEGAIAIHGITDQFLQDKPKFHEIVDELIEFIRGAELIIHNAEFDIGFLEHEFRLSERSHFLIRESCSVIDTLAMARRKHPGQHNSLDALCRRYKVDNTNRSYHGGLLDAELLAQVYLLMTGGQTKLLLDEGLKITDQLQINESVRRPLELIVIQPTEEELNLHDMFFKE